MSLTATSAPTTSPPVDPFPSFAACVSNAFEESIATKPNLFTTDVENLYDEFLAALPPDLRQTYTCRACSRFVETYGGLVTIGEDGVTTPVLWRPDFGTLEPSFARGAGNLFATVKRAKVTGPFYSNDTTWGLPQNHDGKRDCDWRHLHVCIPRYAFGPYFAADPKAKVAEKREEHRLLGEAIAEYRMATVQAAVELLQSGRLARPEKALPQAIWFERVIGAAKGEKRTDRRSNILWRTAVEAPAGWCHVRSGLLGTLLEDLKEGKVFTGIKRSWDEKVHPLAYQRPTAPVSEGNVKQAEKIVAELGIAASLRRRYCLKEDVKVRIWEPFVPDKSEPEGVFSHLLKKSEPADHDLTAPASITWRKFKETVLPRASKIEVWVPPASGSYCALVTAADPDAPPIIQWDHPDARNPVTHYLYVNVNRNDGSYPGNWGLAANSYVNVWAITPGPSHWNADRIPANQPEIVILLLEGARDIHVMRGGAGGGFFPEILKSELHEIRKTLEHYALNAVIEGAKDAEACGVMLHDKARPVQVRVTTRGVRANYTIDRWD